MDWCSFSEKKQKHVKTPKAFLFWTNFHCIWNADLLKIVFKVFHILTYIVTPCFQLGEWVFIASGTGLLPQTQDPVSVFTVAGSNTTLIIPFRNPMDQTVICEVLLRGKRNLIYSYTLQPLLVKYFCIAKDLPMNYVSCWTDLKVCFFLCCIYLCFLWCKVKCFVTWL